MGLLLPLCHLCSGLCAPDALTVTLPITSMMLVLQTAPDVLWPGSLQVSDERQEQKYLLAGISYQWFRLFQ